MSKSIIVGPLLGFETGEFYTVCILTSSQVNAAKLNVSVLQDPVDLQRVASVGSNVFWRAEFQIPVVSVGSHVDYQISSGGVTLEDLHGRIQWSFYVPGQSEQPVIAYGSCNGFSSAKLARDTDEPYKLWQMMVQQHQSQPIALLLMGGDQLYADEIWESRRCPSLQKWNDLSWKKQSAANYSIAMSKEVAAFYDWLYTDRWKDENMSFIFASVPSIMMWDDHDIFDGWGSYPSERQDCDVFKGVFVEAMRTFDLFQLRCSTRNRLNPVSRHRTLALRFRDYHLLVLDNRTERTIERIMSEDHWTEVKGWLKSLKGQTVCNLLVMTGVPAVYRSFSTVEALMDTTPWHEELEDDIHDHWTARSHEAERMRFIMVLLNFLEDQRKTAASTKPCKGVILSGDVHVGALGQIWNERKELGLTQLISSGIVHPPPTAFAWAGVQLMTSDDLEILGDGDVTAEMLTPLNAPKYLRTRNFVTLQTGTDDKIWVNWTCENLKMKPSFAID